MNFLKITELHRQPEPDCNKYSKAGGSTAGLTQRDKKYLRVFQGRRARMRMGEHIIPSQFLPQHIKTLLIVNPPFIYKYSYMF
jgi:hypothetical protein